jgi:hypothetical protein
MRRDRIIGLLAALVFALAVVGCSSSSSTPAPAEGSPAAAESPAT